MLANPSRYGNIECGGGELESVKDDGMKTDTGETRLYFKILGYISLP